MVGNLEGWGPPPEARLMPVALNPDVTVRTPHATRAFGLREHFEMLSFGPL